MYYTYTFLLKITFQAIVLHISTFFHVTKPVHFLDMGLCSSYHNRISIYGAEDTTEKHNFQDTDTAPLCPLV